MKIIRRIAAIIVYFSKFTQAKFQRVISNTETISKRLGGNIRRMVTNFIAIVKRKLVNARSNNFEVCPFYKLLAKKSGIKLGLSLCIVLFIPYLIIATSYIVIRFGTLSTVPIDFWFEITITSSWFVLGPYLVYKFMNLFISLRSKSELALPLQNWFKDNEIFHYKTYKRCMAIICPVFIIIGIAILVYRPSIFTNVVHLTTGYNDIYFWLIWLFLVWLLIYCTNALAAIVLMLIVIYNFKKQNVLDYNPIEISHHKSIKELNSFCNKIVSYMCSGLLFLPIVVFFMRQQLYIEWVSSILLFYGIFLFSAISYPKIAIKSYISKMSKDYLIKEKTQYFNDIKTKNSSDQENTDVVHQLQRYNSYLYLQELKTICPIKMDIDLSTVVTYVSIVVTVATSIPGFVAMITNLTTP